MISSGNTSSLTTYMFPSTQLARVIKSSNFNPANTLTQCWVIVGPTWQMVG